MPEPSETDHVAVYIAEPELGLPETTLAQLQVLTRELPFERSMVWLATLQSQIEPVLLNAEGQWEVAQRFYEGRDDLLRRYASARRRYPKRTIFSPQAITLLMRFVVEHAVDESDRDFTPAERARLRDAVLGAHSARVLATVLEGPSAPANHDILAYELQAGTFFRRPNPLEEMVRHREFLNLADSAALSSSPDFVPVREWLDAVGMRAQDQWAVGFGLAAMTGAVAARPGDEIRPRVPAARVDALLGQLGIADLSPDLPVLSSSRAEFRSSFAHLGGGDESLGWELRPFKSTPFLRLASGDLLLLAPPWLLSWLGEGFHYRAMRHAQDTFGPEMSAKYTRFVGQIVERYALDRAEEAAPESVRVLGEQSYGKKGASKTSDVAIAAGSDLILFEVHARRVAATAAVAGTARDATVEVSKLLVGKINQVGKCVQALLDDDAALPGVAINDVERIFPIVVSVGYVRQGEDLWNYLRSEMKPEAKTALALPRVQPLQVMDIEEFEKLMAFLESGESLPDLLARKTAGEFAERDLPVWLQHDSNAPSPNVRVSAFNDRWLAMGTEVAAVLKFADPAVEDGT